MSGWFNSNRRAKNMLQPTIFEKYVIACLNQRFSTCTPKVTRQRAITCAPEDCSLDEHYSKPGGEQPDIMAQVLPLPYIIDISCPLPKSTKSVLEKEWPFSVA